MEIPTTVKNKQLVEKRREQIVIAAITLFSKKGFHKTTLREIADRAGLSTGNIYDYIGSKEDIFFLIHDFAADKVIEKLEHAVTGVNDPIEKLRRMVRAEFNLMDEWSDAIMLLYQESHILSGKFLHKLLIRERAHLEKFEEVIEECVKRKLLRPSNSRIVANLIKSMVDTWIIKRWDLRGHSTRLEAESAILDLVFNGLLQESKGRNGVLGDKSNIAGKTALLVNTDTSLGEAIFFKLLESGVRTLTVGKTAPGTETEDKPEAHMHHFPYIESLAKPDTFLQELEGQFGGIDLYVQDLGIGNTVLNNTKGGDPQSGARLEENLRAAQNLIQSILEKMSLHEGGKIVLLAPWAWDRHANRLHFETVSAAAHGLVRALAEEANAAGINVNLVEPGYVRLQRPSLLEKSLGSQPLSKIPLQRFGEIEDVINTVMFLLDDASRYVSGEIIRVDGGLGSRYSKEIV